MNPILLLVLALVLLYVIQTTVNNIISHAKESKRVWYYQRKDLTDKERNDAILTIMREMYRKTGISESLYKDLPAEYMALFESTPRSKL